jgi:hypothetical protein
MGKTPITGIIIGDIDHGRNKTRACFSENFDYHGIRTSRQRDEPGTTMNSCGARLR